METDILTIVFGFKNRDLLRVDRCLSSLAKQTYNKFNVILVDYGSDLEISHEISSLVESYSFCHYVYSDTRGWPWNRSRALNIGIRMSTTKYVMTSDIDLIFDSHFVERMMEEVKDDTIIHASCYYLPHRFNRWKDISNFKSKYGQPCKDALGLVFLVERDCYLKVRGFDEFYQFWGIEDRDLQHRFERLGLDTKWLDIDQCALYHQWHAINNNRTFSFMPIGYWEDMELHFGENLDNVIRNDNSWGGVVTRDQRPVLKFIDNTEKAEVVLSVDSFMSAGDISVELAKEFAALNSGEAICIKGKYTSLPSFFLKVINFCNRVLSRLKLGIQVAPNRNNLKDVFWLFFKNNQRMILDFAVSTDEKNYYLIKK